MSKNISANYGNDYSFGTGYLGCNGSGYCHYGFPQNYVSYDSKNNPTDWSIVYYDGPQWAQLTLNMSVKVDNPFGISFTGNTSGYVNIQSNGPVTIGGNILNPTGPTTISAAAGNIAQVANTQILTNGLTLSAPSGSVGTTAQPINATLVGGTLNVTSNASGAVLNLGSGATIGTISASEVDTETVSAQVAVFNIFTGMPTGQFTTVTYTIPVTNYGDVSITAAGNLVAGSGTNGVNIVARDLTIDNTTGSVGTSSAPLVIAAHPTVYGNGGVSDGIVSVTAQSDIALTQTAGDLFVKQINSTAGNVTLTITNGGIYDYNNETASQTLTSDQITKISAQLGLVGSDATAANAAAVANFAALVNNDLTAYSQFIANGTFTTSTTVSLDSYGVALYQPLANSALISSERSAQDGTVAYQAPASQSIQSYANQLNAANNTFILNASQISVYKPFAAAAMNLSVSAISDAQVQEWANAQYQTYASTFALAFGSNWKSAISTVTPGSYSVATGSTAYTTLTQTNGWTQNQILQAIDLSALQPASPVIGAGTPNIIGHNVTIAAMQSSTGAVGKLIAPLTISLSDIENGQLATNQLNALASATTPGSVTFNIVDANGNVISSTGTINDLLAGKRVSSVNIQQTAPLFVSASGLLNVNAGAAVYLQGTPGTSFNLDQVSAGGDVNLQAYNSLLAAQPGQNPTHANQVVSGGNITLAAGSGDIGSAAAPVDYKLTASTGTLLSAQATGNVYLKYDGGDARFDQIYAGQTASLDVTNGSIVGTGPGVAIQGNSIVLVASGTIGSGNTPFEVLLGATGTLTGSSGGSTWLSVPTNQGQSLQSVTFGNFTAGGDLSVTAISTYGDGDINVAAGDKLSANGNLTLTGGAITLGGGSVVKSGGIAALSAETGDIVLGEVESTDAPSAPTTLITLDAAAGSIRSNGDSPNILTPDAATADTVSLYANGNIGDTTNAIAITGGAGVSANAPNGAMWLAGVNGTLTAQSLTANRTIDVTGTSGLNLVNAKAGGTLTADAHGALTYTTLTTTGITGDAGDIKLTSDTASIAGNATSDTLDANGGFDLTAATTIGATKLTSETGAGVLQAGGQITVATTDAATTFAATSTGAGATLTSATSGGAMTVTASGDIDYTSLKTLGTPSDAGALKLTSTSGGVNGQGGSSTVTSNASLTIDAVTAALDTASAGTFADIEVTQSMTGKLLTTGGDAKLVAGVSSNLSPANPVNLAFATVKAGTTFEATSYGGTIDQLTSVTSSGTETITATGTITFGSLTATGGDIDVTSNAGGVSGGTVLANGSADVATSGDNTGTSITTTTGKIVLTATTGKIAWGTLTAATTLDATASGGAIAFTTAKAGGTLTADAHGALTYTTLTTTGITGDAGDIKLTSDTASIAGNATSDTLDANGGFDLTAATTIGATKLTSETGAGVLQAGGQITVATTDAATTFAATSTGAGATLTSATSGGAMTVTASGDIDYTSLKTLGTPSDAGALKLTSTSGGVNGQGGSSTVTSNASLTIDAVTAALDTASAGTFADIEVTQSMTGKLLTTGGDAKLVAGVSSNLSPANPVNLAFATVKAGTTFEATSYGGTIDQLTSVTSSGTETITATGTITFGSLTATGGDIDVTSNAGGVSGGTVLANGSADVATSGDNTGTSITTTTGKIVLTATTGKIAWGTLTAATTLDATASGGAISIGTATSGGTMTLTSNNALSFDQLTTKGISGDAGDINLLAVNGPILGGSATANGKLNATGDGIVFDTFSSNDDMTLQSSGDITGKAINTNGNLTVDSAGDTTLGDANAAGLSLSTPKSVTFNNLTLVTAADFEVGKLTIGVLKQKPGTTTPLQVSITGYHGGIGIFADLFIDTPNEVLMPKLYETNATIRTSSPFFRIDDGLIIQTMSLITPYQTIWMNNLTPMPVIGNDIQMFQPTSRFYLTQDRYAMTTNTFIVQYGLLSQITDWLGGNYYLGPSFVRDFDRLQVDGDPSYIFGADDNDANPNAEGSVIAPGTSHMRKHRSYRGDVFRGSTATLH